MNKNPWDISWNEVENLKKGFKLMVKDLKEKLKMIYNLSGKQIDEELRRKAIEWDKFTDSHKKGEGNMMKRGWFLRPSVSWSILTCAVVIKYHLILSSRMLLIVPFFCFVCVMWMQVFVQLLLSLCPNITHCSLVLWFLPCYWGSSSSHWNSEL